MAILAGYASGAIRSIKINFDAVDGGAASADNVPALSTAERVMLQVNNAIFRTEQITSSLALMPEVSSSTRSSLSNTAADIDSIIEKVNSIISTPEGLARWTSEVYSEDGLRGRLVQLSVKKNQLLDAIRNI